MSNLTVPVHKCVSCGDAIKPGERTHLGVCVFCCNQIFERILSTRNRTVNDYCHESIEKLNGVRDSLAKERAELKNLEAAAKLAELIKEIR